MLRREIKLARQRLLAADRLWVAGCYAEALRLHVSAMQSTLRAVAEHAPGVAINAPSEVSLPDPDEDVGPAERDLHHRVRRSTEEAIAALVGAEPVAPPRRAKLVRIALASIAALVLVGTIVALRWPTLSASASASYGSGNAPRKAIDGDVTTEWWLPDGVGGSLELRVSPPRAIRRIRLLNAQDPTGPRATAQYVLHVIDRGVEVRTLPGDLPFATVAAWRAIQIDVARADLIRVEIVAFHGKGGGFAEVEVE